MMFLVFIWPSTHQRSLHFPTCPSFPTFLFKATFPLRSLIKQIYACAEHARLLPLVTLLQLWQQFFLRQFTQVSPFPSALPLASFCQNSRLSRV